MLFVTDKVSVKFWSGRHLTDREHFEFQDRLAHEAESINETEKPSHVGFRTP